MRGAGVHFGRTFGLERGRRGHQRTARVDHVVVQDAYLAGHVADKRRDLGLVVLGAVLVHDGQVAVQHVRELLRRLGTAHVGRDDAQLVGVEALVLVVVHEDGHGRHVVHRQVEEALDGVLVQVDGDDVVHAGDRQQVGHQLGADGLARGGLAVLARIAIVGHHRAHVVGRRALGGIHHDEQFHERVVHVVAVARTHRLHEKHVCAAHAFQIAGIDLAVGELLELDVAQRASQLRGNLFGKLVVHRARKQKHGFLRVHEPPLLRPSLSCQRILLHIGSPAANAGSWMEERNGRKGRTAAPAESPRFWAFRTQPRMPGAHAPAADARVLHEGNAALPIPSARRSAWWPSRGFRSGGRGPGRARLRKRRA